MDVIQLISSFLQLQFTLSPLKTRIIISRYQRRATRDQKTMTLLMKQFIYKIKKIDTHKLRLALNKQKPQKLELEAIPSKVYWFHSFKCSNILPTAIFQAPISQPFFIPLQSTQTSFTVEPNSSQG